MYVILMLPLIVFSHRNNQPPTLTTMSEPGCPPERFTQKTSTEPQEPLQEDLAEGQEKFPDDSTSIMLPKEDDEVETGDLSDSSSGEDSVTYVQVVCERDYLRDQLEFIIEHLESNMPLHPSGPDLPLPWAEGDPLGVVRDHVVAAIEKLFEFGTAEGMFEAQKALVLKAKCLCEEQSVARLEAFLLLL